MLRKSILVLSLASIAALIAWEFAPSRSMSACAATSTSPCALDVEVSNPKLQGTPAKPTGATVAWKITNLPPCYRIVGADVTFNFTMGDASVESRPGKPKFGPAGGTAEADLTKPLPANKKVGAITATVIVNAIADPIKKKSDSGAVSF